MMSRRFPKRYGSRFSGRRGGNGRIVIGLIFAVIALVSYFSSKSFNPVTGEDQYISITPEQEIALGVQSVPQMIDQFGGLHQDIALQNYLDKIGYSLLASSQEIKDLPWEYEFYLLNDPQTINAFALPGGQIFITYALFSRLKTEGQLAGVIGHEIGHVVARHSAQRIAKSKLTQGLTGAVMTASGDYGSAQMAAMIGQMINMKYGRDDELESDQLGIVLMSRAGYDPRSMVGVMEILSQASSGARQPEFFSTHPNPDNRIGMINETINELFPNGVPEGLKP